MADDTQGRAQQKAPATGTNRRAVDKGEAVAAARDTRATQERRREAASTTKAAPADTRPTAEEIAERDPKTYRALDRGYIDGRIVEPGEIFTTTADKGEWMEPVKKGADQYGVEKAADEAAYGKRLDVDYEGMDPAALQALAALLGVSKPGELDKDELITAIKAARIPVAQ